MRIPGVSTERLRRDQARGLWQVMLLGAILLLAGCIHGPAPYLPEDWPGMPLAPEDLGDRDEPRLQMLIMYGGAGCLHTALRLYSPQSGALFWDPAGGYGTPYYPIRAERRSDLVVAPVPDLEDYLWYRVLEPTRTTEIFEYRISPGKAAELVAVLAGHAAAASFPTRSVGPFCNLSVSTFLHRFAGDEILVSHSFFPHALARELYKQHPVRVILADHSGVHAYRPPGAAVVPAGRSATQQAALPGPVASLPAFEE